ncbi:hypothetical protein JOM56_013424 [Amanita muscaria]
MPDRQSKVETLANNLGLKNTSRHMIFRHDTPKSNHCLQYQTRFQTPERLPVRGKTQSSPDANAFGDLTLWLRTVQLVDTSMLPFATLPYFRCAIKRKDIYRLVSQHGNTLRTREESKTHRLPPTSSDDDDDSAVATLGSDRSEQEFPHYNFFVLFANGQKMRKDIPHSSCAFRSLQRRALVLDGKSVMVLVVSPTRP